MNLDSQHIHLALRRTAESLGPQDTILQIVVGGGCAGLLAGLLAADRTTADCDVYWSGDAGQWDAIAEAARATARQLGLPPEWLNRDCTIFAWCLPIGWQSRCVRVAVFGSVEILRLSRLDLIAAKVISAPRRPQDLEDLFAIKPLDTELDEVEQHIDRLESEDLDRREYVAERAIVAALRGAP